MSTDSILPCLTWTPVSCLSGWSETCWTLSWDQSSTAGDRVGHRSHSLALRSGPQATQGGMFVAIVESLWPLFMIKMGQQLRSSWLHLMCWRMVVLMSHYRSGDHSRNCHCQRHLHNPDHHHHPDCRRRQPHPIPSSLSPSSSLSFSSSSSSSSSSSAFSSSLSLSSSSSSSSSSSYYSCSLSSLLSSTVHPPSFIIHHHSLSIIHHPQYPHHSSLFVILVFIFRIAVLYCFFWSHLRSGPWPGSLMTPATPRKIFVCRSLMYHTFVILGSQKL